MTRRVIIVVLALWGLVAFCMDSMAKTIELIQNEQVRDYSRDEIERGAPSLPVTSKILRSEALEDLAGGRRDAAIEKLKLAASLSGESAAPLFTLARIELLSGNPDGIMHFIEGLRRSFSGFPGAAIAALNWGALAVLAFAGALFTLLVSFLARYWGSIDHTIVENRSLRFRKLPARWILPLAVLALAFLGLGLGIYIAALIVVLWAFLGKRERIIVFSLAAILTTTSFVSPLSNRFAPAVDPGSATRCLSLVNERSVSSQRLAEIRAIDENRYRAERDYAVGTMMYRLGLYSEARGYLLDAVSADPGFAPAFVNLGNVYFMQGDYDKALAGYRSAVELDSTNAVVHYNIGQAYIKKMLFAQSGDWLERASTLGIEAYRSTQPALEMRSAVVYEQGFPPKDLWRIAAAEGSSRDRVILSEMLQPFLLIPFHRLWILLVPAMAAAFIVARRMPKDRQVERCDNCGLPSCPRCSETIHDITLCKECCKAVQGIASTKVMEVLLRSRRQKVADARSGVRLRRAAFLPGMAQAYHGKTLAGFILAFAGVAAAGTLYWRGLYFKNPLTMNTGVPAWETILPAAILVGVYALALLAKSPTESRSYHIFSPETRSQDREPAPARREDHAGLWLSPDSTSPARRKQFVEPAAPSPKTAEPPRKAPPPEAMWGAAPPPSPPRRSAADEPAKGNAGAPKPPAPKTPAPKAPAPGRSDTAVATEDFLAEIKKGSSWR